MTRELPSFGVSMLSRPGPIQLNGRNSVKSSWPWMPYAQITRSISCLEHGVDPALLVDRAEHELGLVGIELRRRRHMPYTSEVDGKDDALAVLHAAPHDRQVRLEVELEHACSGSRDVGGAGLAIATSGSTTSHFLMWYSIHSRLMVMSPSKK